MKAREMVTTTATFPREMYRRVQHFAVDEDTTIRDMIREAVADYLERKEKKGGRQ
jgi:predicted transcriptional regulator